MGVGLSIFKPGTCERFKNRNPETVLIQEITDEKIRINESTLVPFNVADHTKYILVILI